jgi:nucleoside-diphosphate-sugar epimerase
MHSPVYVGDLVDGVVRAATVPEAAGRIFTVTGSQAVTIGDFVAHYCRMLGLDRPRSVPAPVARTVARVIDSIARARGAPNEVTPAAIDYFMRRGTYSIARAREVLGYEPAVDLDEGMRRTEAWLRSEGLL